MWEIFMTTLLIVVGSGNIYVGYKAYKKGDKLWPWLNGGVAALCFGVAFL
jgi:hypothetical protein